MLELSTIRSKGPTLLILFMCQRCHNLGQRSLYCHEKIVDSLNSLNIFHQNTRGLRNKCDELINSIILDSINPHILCLSEYHVEEQDLLNLILTGYFLGSSYCCWNLQKGGVCIFVRDGQSFNKIDTSFHCTEQILKVHAI
jgi:hypothetical protein